MMLLSGTESFLNFRFYQLKFYIQGQASYKSLLIEARLDNLSPPNPRSSMPPLPSSPPPPLYHEDAVEAPGPPLNTGNLGTIRAWWSRAVAVITDKANICYGAELF